MADQSIEAELQRRNPAGALASWELVTDASSDTGLADPVSDAEARTSLASILSTLQTLLSELQSGGAGEVTVRNPTTAPETGLAKESTLTSILTELQQKLESGDEVALDATTLAALESITATVANMPSTFPLPTGQVSTLTPQTDGLTDAELRASAVNVTGPLTDTQLRDTPIDVAISGEPVDVAITGSALATQATLAAVETALGTLLTELQQKLEAGQEVALDATTLAALESITATISGTVSVTGPLTDAELRAADVPVSGPLTDTQLRASPVDVSITSTTASRSQVAGLSFNETLTALGSYQTSWVDVSSHAWLDITTDIEAAAALTATIEFTDAADPNTTPPATGDVTRPLTTTLAAAALGGVDDPSFGIPAQMTWCRITVTDITGGQDVVVSTFGQDDSSANALLPVAAAVKPSFRAALTKAVVAGIAPDGDYADLPVDGPVSRDNSVDSGTLPSGPTPTFDPVGPIVASNVIDTGWIDMEQWNYQSFRSIFNVPGIKVFLMDASDDQGNHSVTTSFDFPNVTSPAFGSSDLGARFFQKYFRIIIYNDTGTDCTDWAYASFATNVAPGPISISLDQQLQDFFPAPVVRAVQVGRQPDGDYVNQPATGLAQDRDGVNVETTATLGSGGVFQSGWCDTDGWDEIEVVVKADQVSATDGVLLEFTDDAGATTPAVRETQVRTFTADDVTRGAVTFRVPPRLDGFRISYTNGGVAQSDFYLGVVLRADVTAPPRGPIEASVSATSDAVMGRDVLFAEDADSPGDYSNIQQRSGGLRVSVANQEVKTPPATSDDAVTRTGTATTTAAIALASSSAMANRTGVIVINNDNNTELRFATSTARINGGQYARIDPGKGIVIPLSSAADICLRSGSGNVTYSLIEVAEVSDT